jgi:hypothetical protein
MLTIRIKKRLAETVSCSNGQFSLIWKQTWIAAREDEKGGLRRVKTPEEMRLDDHKFRNIKSLKIAFLNLSVAGPDH